ncbi:MAG: DUF3094 family protein [Endozoicomonas sp.]
MSQAESAGETTEPHQNKTRLYPEDQQRVDEFLKEGVNTVERPPFKPVRLMLWLAVVIIALGGLSRLIGRFVLPT